MPQLEVMADRSANDYCFVCDETTRHHPANARWEDGSIEYLCFCTKCRTVHESVIDDRVPHQERQREVHTVVERYLQAVVDQDETKLNDISGDFRKDWLFGLQVMEEALVVQENEPIKWTLDAEALHALWHNCDKIRAMIETLRGRPRKPTTPTLPGGGKRPQQ